MKMIFGKLRSKFVKPKFAYLTLVGGFLVQMTLGTLYTFGNMSTYFLKYLNNTNVHLQGQIDPAQLTWIFGLGIFGFGASMSFGGFLIPKIGVIATILTGSWMMSLGVVVTYFTIDSYLSFVTITYGLIVGLGIGTAYGTILSIPGQWFPENKGLVTGIIIAGFGFSSIPFDFAQTYFISGNSTKTNTTDSNSETYRIKISFLFMGGIYAICQLIGAALIRTPSFTNKIDFSDSTSVELIQRDFQEFSRKPLEILFEKNFWILWLTYLLNSYFIVLVLSLHKLYGLALELDNSYHLTITTACGSLFNGIGRIVWGYFMDKVSYKKIMSVLTLSMSVMIGTFCLVNYISQSSGKFAFYFIWVVILHFLLSASFSIFPVICSRCFGMKYSVINYGILFTAYALAGIVTSAAITPIFNNHIKTKMYNTAFLIGCGLTFLSFIINLMYQEKMVTFQRLNNCEI